MNVEQSQSSWDEIAIGYDRHVTPTHMWLANEGLKLVGIHEGMSFLDVAAGTGALSIPAARIGAQVLSTDISPIMLEQLKKRAIAEGLDLETRVMDGHALELDDDIFDVSGSQFGVMLFPDMPRGIREIARVVKPSGNVLILAYGTPQDIEFLVSFITAVRVVIPGFTGPPLDPVPLPFQLQDTKRMKQVMIEAGLKDVRIKTITERLEFRSGQELWDWLINSNPIVEMILAELNLSDEQMEIVRQALDKMIDERSSGRGSAVLSNPVNIGIGTK